ncbi:AtuA-related protein [Pseudofrankia inefficax]|uniref:Beta-lactamase n=1 Tax=Pseudofrankia inefficax (strain DSM 45817 / CECT 9037 / DDB 130130 / EuI1c) TaxID=298654 RepID=E3JAM4_PSEI1|nr:hypothetical protein [Pseudofrankia inefficax]ADP82216.1 beta-lactamase [Pseudofrankia inefficax]
MRLYELAHARAGDKGNISDISVIAYRIADFEHIRRHVTTERVRAHFGESVRGAIVRYELPRLAALKFVLHDALDGGVTRSLALDSHGKTLSFWMLELDLPAPN